jgi:hypothetical protein
MDAPTINAYSILMPWIGPAPPWVVLAALVGAVSAATFYICAGRGLRSLPTYFLLGVMAAPLGQVAIFVLGLDPGWLTVGEVDLALLAVGTWGLLGIARLLRL